MKIMIVGFSGAGKSSLAKTFSKYYNIPVLYLDTVQFLDNWIDRDNNEANEILKNFLDKNDNWVIDGNYESRLFERRAIEADKIYFLNFNRFLCLERVFKRYNQFKNKERESMTKGCNEKLNLSFVNWVFFEGRNKKHQNKYNYLRKNYSKKLIEIKNPIELKEILKKLGIKEIELKA